MPSQYGSSTAAGSEVLGLLLSFAGSWDLSYMENPAQKNYELQQDVSPELLVKARMPNIFVMRNLGNDQHADRHGKYACCDWNAGDACEHCAAKAVKYINDDSSRLIKGLFQLTRSHISPIMHEFHICIIFGVAGWHSRGMHANLEISAGDRIRWL